MCELECHCSRTHIMQHWLVNCKARHLHYLHIIIFVFYFFPTPSKKVDWFLKLDDVEPPFKLWVIFLLHPSCKEHFLISEKTAKSIKELKRNTWDWHKVPDTYRFADVCIFLLMFHAIFPKKRGFLFMRNNEICLKTFVRYTIVFFLFLGCFNLLIPSFIEEA